MQGGINDTKVFLPLDDQRINGNAMHLIKINLIDIFTDDLNQVLIALELDVLHLYLVHLIDNGCVMRSQHLCTVFPIGLVTVVLARIVAGSDIDTALATQWRIAKDTSGVGLKSSNR